MTATGMATAEGTGIGIGIEKMDTLYCVRNKFSLGELEMRNGKPLSELGAENPRFYIF